MPCFIICDASKLTTQPTNQQKLRIQRTLPTPRCESGSVGSGDGRVMLLKKLPWWLVHLVMIDNTGWGGVEWNSRKPCVFIQESTEEWGLQSVVDGDKLRTILKTWSKCSMMPSPIPVTAMSPLTSSLSNFLSQLAGYAVTSLLLCHRLLQDGRRVPILQTLETSCNALHELKRVPMGTYSRISACRPRDTNYEKRQQDRMVWGEKKLSENKSAFSGPTS